jgi:uncharacterized membrane protein
VRALGLQFAVSIVTLVCYYFFGLPLAIRLGFKKDLALYGFWLGFTIAVTILDVIVVILVVRADWSRKEEKDEQDEESEWSLQSALKKVSAKGGFAGLSPAQSPYLSPLMNLNASFTS